MTHKTESGPDETSQASTEVDEASAEAQFGAHVRQAREAKGWTQSVLARHLKTLADIDLHQTAIARVESGKRPVRLNEAIAFAQLLGLDLNGYGGMVLDAEAYARAKAELERLTEEEADFRRQLDAMQADSVRIQQEIVAISNFRWKLAAGIKAYEDRQGGQ